MLLLHWSLLVAIVAAQCPDWRLPWGTYKGSDDGHHVCLYSNIRYASPPLGQLRFAAPSYPPKFYDPGVPGPNPVCIQMNETRCLPKGPQFGGSRDGADCFGPYYGTQSEDCLFLDVYVPKSVFTTKKYIPVIAWFFGGAYLFGSKTAYDPKILPFYSGDGVIDVAKLQNEDRSKQNAIFVAGNYRLGAFGWLAGPYMEQNGQPNAGLLDQRAILQFIKDNIATVYGDGTDVSVWGESAGASSIMHHLAMPLNRDRPLFRKAVVQSPAYQWLWDPTKLNQTFNDYATNVSLYQNCRAPDMACLRGASSDVLKRVNSLLFQDAACKGILPVGPAVDRNLVPTLASAQFYSQKAVTNVDTIIVSHVDLEVPYSNTTTDWSFIPLNIRANPHSELAFQQFLAEVFPGNRYSTIRVDISAKYRLREYSDQIARAAAVIANSSFTCNTRFMIDRYLNLSKPVYAMNYAVLEKYGSYVWNGSTHGSDLLPLFMKTDTSYEKILKCLNNLTSFDAGLANDYIYDYTAGGMQQYFSDHAIWGDPNKNIGNWRTQTSHTWHKASIGICSPGYTPTCVQSIMKPVTNIFSSPYSNNRVIDRQTGSDSCNFWGDIAVRLSAVAAGLPDPGSMIEDDETPFISDADGQHQIVLDNDYDL